MDDKTVVVVDDSHGERPTLVDLQNLKVGLKKQLDEINAKIAAVNKII